MLGFLFNILYSLMCEMFEVCDSKMLYTEHFLILVLLIFTKMFLLIYRKRSTRGVDCIFLYKVYLSQGWGFYSFMISIFVLAWPTSSRWSVFFFFFRKSHYVIIYLFFRFLFVIVHLVSFVSVSVNIFVTESWCCTFLYRHEKYVLLLQYIWKPRHYLYTVCKALGYTQAPKIGEGNCGQVW